MDISELDGVQEQSFDMDSFLMVGQSNMSGRGELDELEPFGEHDCWMLRMGRWQVMTEPVNPDRTFTGRFHSGVGLASAFAYEYYKETRRKTGLIPCADGGTKIDQWLPGQVDFDHALFQAELATRSSELKGILWHQGESDCRGRVTDAYFDKLYAVLKTFRMELGDVPIVMGEISEQIVSETWNIELSAIRDMNGIIHAVADALPNCSVASSQGLLLKDDGIHFCTKAQQEFGRRYFEQYKKMCL